MFKYILIASSFMLLSVSSCKKCVDVDVPYTEEVPYNAIEEVDVKLTYNVGESSWNRVSGSTFFNEKPRLKSYTYITNTGDRGGVFELIKKYTSTLNETITLKDSKYIPAGETVKFEFDYELDDYVNVKSDGYDINAPSVKIEKRVTKYRTVTKYRKCNTCVEDCGEYYKSNDTPWYIYLIIVFAVIGLIGWIKEKFL